MATLLEQLDQVRCQAEACLYTTGSVLEVRAGVSAMANVPLPPSVKYRYIAAEAMIIENTVGLQRKEVIGTLQRLSTALNILEKYGCNLTCPSRPKYWRTVKHNNPVFRATVDSIQGGRAVLSLYGYSNQQPDGLSFPDDVMEPDVGKVAAVTLEVMSLRMELDMLIKEAHPHTEFFERIVPSLGQQGEVGGSSDVTANQNQSQPRSLPPAQPPRSIQAFCPGRTANASTSTCTIPATKHIVSCTICGIFPVAAHCPTCVQSLCTECDRLYHSYPERANHHRTTVITSKSRKLHSSSQSSWRCVHCTTINSLQDVLCEACGRPRLACTGPAASEDATQPPNITEWQCKSCTVVNAGSSILCEVCERPRLATRPPVTPTHPPNTPPRPPAPVLGMPGDPDSQWVCQFCTYVNYTPATVCEMCDLARPEPAPMPAKLRPPSPVRRVPALPVKPKAPPPEDPDLRRQRLMREEGLKMIQLIRPVISHDLCPLIMVFVPHFLSSLIPGLVSSACPNCRFQYALSKGGCMHFSCSQCRYQFCSGCNNPFHTTCAVNQCSVTGLHAHHPRDCLFYLRDWEPSRLQALLLNKGVEFNTDTPPGTQSGLCGVVEQKDEGGQQSDSACGAETLPGQAGLCEKHYREYLVNLINGHSIDPASLFNANELVLACRRYQVDDTRGEAEEDLTYYSRLLEKLVVEVPLGDKVPRKK
ncbi:E3 ubiquitin-protein ligase RNF31 [Hypomesus transpacificus]|uniref:E3 ubiquitin-protein ligase RNF31 n=1 Tax=Hypomesus transpacificus TaxID=137520 RepID=UPI001F0759B2|nr:E3 ubiquitin-protein ligase RNF31 [Hypomesus transpacificus]